MEVVYMQLSHKALVIGVFKEIRENMGRELIFVLYKNYFPFVVPTPK